MYKSFEYVGYLFIHSPEPQSGKSRLLEILDLLVFNSSNILVSPTEAVLFRTADASTQLLDEVDGWTNKDDLRSVLNAGYRRGGVVARMDDERGKYVVKKFPVFSPRALAGIGTGILNATTRDRSFMLEMVRQTKEERKEQFRIRKIQPEIEGLKQRIQEWVDRHREEVAECYDRSDFAYLENFRDRTIDISQPLVAVLEVVYRDDQQQNDARNDLIEAIEVTRQEDQDPYGRHHEIFEELLRLAQEEDPLVGNATELAEKCTGLETKPEPHEVSAALRTYNFKTRSIRKDGEPKKRYELPLEQLLDIVVRYTSPNGAEMAVAEPEEEADPEAAEIAP